MRDIQQIAKKITEIENSTANFLDDKTVNYKAKVIGFTGTPGAGKSTILNKFIFYLRSKNKSVAVLAIDPSSPLTGGSLLGDRVRMNRHAEDDNVFIRSMSSRGKLGGLSNNITQIIQLLDNSGFDFILIETVGAGQNEVEIKDVAQKTVVVLTPSSGDEIQVFKSGLMEIADIFLLNKIDLPGVAILEQDLQDMLLTRSHDIEKKIPPIIKIDIDDPDFEKLYNYCNT